MVCFVTNHYTAKAFSVLALSIRGLGVYADLDIGQYTGHNGLIVGGTGHPNRLLITDRTNPKEGVALGLRALKNASRMGWVGSPDIYHGRNGEVLDASILTGAYSGWGNSHPTRPDTLALTDTAPQILPLPWG